MINFAEFQKANATVLSNDCTMQRCGVPVNNVVDITNKMSPEAAEKFRTNMLHSLADVKSQMADKYVYTSAVVSVGFVVLQVCKLINVWQEIKNAENLHKDKTKFLEIEQNIRGFEEMGTRLAESITNQHIDDIIIDTVDLNEKYTETLLLINNLKVKINGVMQRLDLASTGQIYDGVSNILMADNTSNSIIFLKAQILFITYQTDMVRRVNLK